MGAEAFGVSIRLIEPGNTEKVRTALATSAHICIEERKTVGDFEIITGEYDDGDHFIDLQILRNIASDECTLAIRFSLCSYDTTDAIFIDLVHSVLSLWDAEVWLMTSALRQKTNYLPGDSQWLIAALPEEIIEMRRYWQELFGCKQGAVRVKDSFSFVNAFPENGS